MTKILSTALLALLMPTYFLSTVKADKCYAIAFSAGDERAAYQAGVFTGFVNNLSADQVAYSAISGVEGGAINAAILAQYSVGQEKEAAQAMQSFWADSTKTPLYKDWAGGAASGLIFHGGLYDSSPLKSFLKSKFSSVQSMNRDVSVGLVDMLKGAWMDFSASDLITDTLVNVMYASMSKTPFTAPVEFGGSAFYDGSAIWDIDIPTAINKCLEKVNSQKDIILDVIMTTEKVLTPVDTSKYNSIEMGLRFFRIANYYGVMDGLLRAQFAYPDVQFRYVVGPS